MPRAGKDGRMITAWKESDITAQVRDACRFLGIAIERQNTGGAHFPNRDGSSRYVAFGEKGDADWRGSIRGRQFGLEIKAPGRRPSPEQMAKLVRINQSGGIGIWTDDGGTFLLAMLALLTENGRVEFDEENTPWVCWGETNRRKAIRGTTG